jgi:hypothetical protein
MYLRYPNNSDRLGQSSPAGLSMRSIAPRTRTGGASWDHTTDVGIIAERQTTVSDRRVRQNMFSSRMPEEFVIQGPYV